jgi:hypothetical protein
MKRKKMEKKLNARVKGYEEMVKHSAAGGKEYTKPGSQKKGT